MEEEYKYEDFKDKIKDICAMCLNPIDNSWESYLQRGNYCTTCNAKCQVNSKTMESKQFRKKTLDSFNLTK